MSLVEELFAEAQRVARFFHDREPKKSFVHNTGTIKGWYICTIDVGNGVGWSARTEIILTPNGELHALYILSVSVADTEDRKPRRNLRLITKADPWPDSQKRTALKALQQIAV